MGIGVVGHLLNGGRSHSSNDGMDFGGCERVSDF